MVQTSYILKFEIIDGHRPPKCWEIVKTANISFSNSRAPIGRKISIEHSETLKGIEIIFI